MLKKFKVKLSSMPNMRTQKEVEFNRLDGGLNLWELEYRMDANQSPDMLNLWWTNGGLKSRDGQIWINNDTTLGVGYTCYERLFHGYAFFHIGAGIWYMNLNSGSVPVVLRVNVPQIKGTFFRYGHFLYYKTDGAYIKIRYTPDENIPFSAEDVSAYTPIILKRCDPVTAVGERCQSSNRFTGQKIVFYDAGYKTSQTVTSEGETMIYSGTLIYRLPEKNVDSVDSVMVGDELLNIEEEYTVNLHAGLVMFMTSPFDTVGIDNIVNAVRITYTKADVAASNMIAESTRAAVYTVGDESCIVFGGGESQPNAFIWSGLGADLNDGYFPFEQYNTGGDAADAVTGFGHQQGMLVVFREQSVGKVSGSIKNSGEQKSIEFEYVTINAKIGCDLPDSIQMIENNLVFCNSRNGVYYISSTSTARENNIVHISRNINGSYSKNGLLEDISKSGNVCSMSNGKHYWITTNGKTYVWDYSISDELSPSWFRFNNINAVSYVSDGKDIFHIDGAGRITKFERCFYDYDMQHPIEKKYRFPVQSFGDYYRLKDIEEIVIAAEAENGSVIDLKYITDFEERYDAVPFVAASWSILKRDLTCRSLSNVKFAATFKRRPYCKHIRHFAMEAYNSKPLQDMALISVKLIYRIRSIEK